MFADSLRAGTKWSLSNMEAEQKKILKPLVLTLRHLLEGRYDEHGNWHGGDLEARMNSLGVWWDRESIPADDVSYQSDEDRHARKVIDAYLSLRVEAGIERKAAIEEFVRETAYTWANRLLVLRCMEARDLIDPQVVLTKEVYGGRSQAHNRLAQRQPERCSGADGGLFAMFEEAFATHSKHLPLLFDPKAPGVALRPSVASLRKCIGLLSGTESVHGNNPATNEVFAAPDALGWSYQYWNTEEKDRVFEKVRTKKAKIQGADIIPATQLYTEPYMVKFLVQNSLGATWMGMYPDSDLAEDWEYYVKDADRAPVRRKNMENITFLDPACGSGHFLIEAFDLYYRMYETEGKYTDPETICKKILTRNLYGIDIDERAVQIARAALWMKAAERVFDFTGTPKNIIATNIRLPKGKDHIADFLRKHPEDALLQPALTTIFEGLAHADELGSLLQIEEPVEKELRHLKERLGGQTKLTTGELTGQTGFSDPMTNEDWDSWKDGVIERLAAHFKEEAEAADLVNAFFSQNAGKGVRLFELLSKRYDVVAANPPYMGSGNMGDALKRYVANQYPEGKRDLYAAFIVRNIHLTIPSGKIAMLAQQSWMFLHSFSDFRAINEEIILKAPQNSFRGILRETRIETLAHLGENAFNEAAAAGAFVVLFNIANVIPTEEHQITAFRLIGPKNAEDKTNHLIHDVSNQESNSKYVSLQKRFLEIPESPLCYWLSDSLFNLINRKTLNSVAEVHPGLCTGNDTRFVRYFWEIDPLNWRESKNSRRWFKFQKGGGYGRWFGYHLWAVDWKSEGEKIKNAHLPGTRVQNERHYFINGWTYSQLARGKFGLRLLLNDEIYGHASPSISSNNGVHGVGAIGNVHLSSYIIRSISAKMGLNEGYVSRIPCPENIECYQKCENFCIKSKQISVNIDILDYYYLWTSIPFDKKTKSNFEISNLDYYKILAQLYATEGFLERTIYQNYKLNTFDISTIIKETGTIAGWHPLIKTYDTLPSLPANLPDILQEVLDYLAEHERLSLSSSDLTTLKEKLCTLYEAGPGAKVDIEDGRLSNDVDEETGAYIPIPPETFLEELSQKLKIHPISVYWLLKEGIEKEGWRCIPEEQRITADRFTVIILRMLGHRWPKQIEAGETVPDWADADGIIPLTSGAGEETFLERLRMQIAREFPGSSVSAIEAEFEEVMGKSLEDWLHIEFFKHHTQQFKKRPIAWQVQSGKFTKKKQPAFACMVYYHKLDEDTLYKIKNQYVGPLRQKYETEMRGIEGIPVESRNEAQEKRYRELGDLIAELKAFGDTLTGVAESGFASKTLEKIVKNEPLDAWCSTDGVKAFPADTEALLRQERSYIPDINDGVRVNVVPLQKAGLLAADVIAKKDLEKAVSDRAEWRADERRWCREGKLPKCGWW